MIGLISVGDLAIWRSGDLAIWRSGDLAIWRSGDLWKEKPQRGDATSCLRVWNRDRIASRTDFRPVLSEGIAGKASNSDLATLSEITAPTSCSFAPHKRNEVHGEILPNRPFR
jgi:hypothetical protein